MKKQDRTILFTIIRTATLVIVSYIHFPFIIEAIADFPSQIGPLGELIYFGLFAPLYFILLPFTLKAEKSLRQTDHFVERKNNSITIFALWLNRLNLVTIILAILPLVVLLAYLILS